MAFAFTRCMSVASATGFDSAEPLCCKKIDKPQSPRRRLLLLVALFVAVSRQPGVSPSEHSEVRLNAPIKILGRWRARGSPVPSCVRLAFQHLDDIVCNAAIFYELWRRWPMQGWLVAFEDQG